MTQPQKEISYDSNMISTILESIFSSIRTVYLTGSWANQEVDDESDIDLIVVVSEKTDRIDMEAKVKQLFHNSKLNNRIIDAMIYSENEFQDDFNGINHFQLWLSISKGVLLYGSEIKAKLNIQKVHQSMGYWLNRLSETGLLIESGSKYSRCCYDLYAALVWFYFINRYMTTKKEQTGTKRELLATHFGSCVVSVSDVYNTVVMKYRETRQNIGPVVTSVRDSKKSNESGFQCLGKAWNSVSKYCQKVYKETTEEYYY
ncbi:MAG: nucleotidyltransferase domain-containing protein [Candidatus Thorarchaeota archaeon]|nr:nucleotidyltransferase domain-containing protein [Candidatus Thorarchaeota archaeon]